MKKLMTEREKAIQTALRWRRMCAPDLDNVATGILAGYITNALIEAKRQGITIAAEVAKDYDKYSYHDHLVSECILGKLNVLKRRPKRNPAAAKIKKALDGLERKVDGLEGTTKFMAMAAARNAKAFGSTKSKDGQYPI